MPRDWHVTCQFKQEIVPSSTFSFTHPHFYYQRTRWLSWLEALKWSSASQCVCTLVLWWIQTGAEWYGYFTWYFRVYMKCAQRCTTWLWPELQSESCVGHVHALCCTELKSCAVRLWVERQWEPLSRKCCNRYGRVLGPNTMLPSWRVRVYLCLYVHMVLCPCMCLLSWQRPAAHSSNIDGCRHVILHISSSYRWKMKCKKAPGITFVSHHIWVCILIYKYFKSVFLGLVWAVNVNVSSCYSFTPLPFYIPFSVTLIMMYCEVMSAVIMNCRKSHWRCSEYSYQCVLIFKYSHWYSREKAQNRARNLWSLKHFPGPETEGLQLVPVWRGAGS